jgi:four helix bundle protein
MSRQTASGSGPGSCTFTGTGTGEFDHEKLEVYRVARTFLEVSYLFTKRKMERDLREQFGRASTSILANIGEGAGKTARADKQRLYEIARGSATETATLLDVMLIRGDISTEEYKRSRELLVRVVQMLSRLCGSPRTT